MPRAARSRPAVLSLAWATDGGDDCLLIRGWRDDELAALTTTPPSVLSRRLPVYPTEVVQTARSSAALQAVAGRYAVSHDGVRFVPRFPFVAGTSYSVLVHTSTNVDANDAEADDEVQVVTMMRPMVDAEPTTTVVEIFPTAPSIPRNQLRLYVQFSAPMAEGQALERIHVMDASTGEVLDHVFSPTDPELWDPTRTRLTMLFDPARIKRGLRAHREVGYPLVEGRSVRLIVDAEYRDAAGQPLVQSFERRYDVGHNERRRAAPDRWEIEPPKAGTTDPLVLRFDRPLDYALLQHCLVVVTGDGRRLEGAIAIEAGERCWSFRPNSPWAGVPHRLWVDQILEDGAGNSVRRVFDRDLTAPHDAPLATGPATVEFTPVR